MILSKLIFTQNLEVLKFVIENKIQLYDIGTAENLFNFMGRPTFADQFFKPLGLINDKTLVRNNSKITSKHLLYLLYKNINISKDEREIIIRKLMIIVDFNVDDTLSTLIKMRDQDLVE